MVNTTADEQQHMAYEVVPLFFFKQTLSQTGEEWRGKTKFTLTAFRGIKRVRSSQVLLIKCT